MEATRNMVRLILCVLIISMAAGAYITFHCHMIGYNIGVMTLRDKEHYEENEEHKAPGGFFDASFIAFE